MIKVQGSISIDYSVECPHCDEYHWTGIKEDKKWFDETFGEDFPMDGYDGSYEAICMNCKKEFIIDGFVY